MDWVSLAALWVQSAGAASPEGFTSSGFPQREGAALLCSSCSGLAEVPVKSADFGFNMYIFVLIGKSC